MSAPHGTPAWQAVAVRKLLLVPLVALLLVVAGCTGGNSASKGQTPQDRLVAAKEGFDAADYIGFTLAADALPDGVDGLLNARGTGTHDPAFTGDVEVRTTLTIKAPLIAVNGVVYAKLPFAGWSKLDPADYGAPDPATLMDPSGGISSLFTATADPRAGGATREGDQILTTISGTIPGPVVKAVFPSSGTSNFHVTYTLTDANQVSSIKVTGPFYDGSGDVTYTLDFDLSADPVDIAAPI